MVSAGNHENAYNFSHYAERFVMPGRSDPGGRGGGRATANQYYSFDVGPVHVAAYNGEGGRGGAVRVELEIGPMDQWTNGPMYQWTNGPMDQWTNRLRVETRGLKSARLVSDSYTA